MSEPAHIRVADVCPLPLQVVQEADDYTKATVGGKLELIAEQIKALQSQARSILENAERDVQLNHARCNFQRRVGGIYHLYRRTLAGGETCVVWSMLSPSDWSGNPPDEFLGSYRFEGDHSWTKFEDIAAREKRRQFDPVMLGVQDSSGASMLTLKNV